MLFFYDTILNRPFNSIFFCKIHTFCSHHQFHKYNWWSYLIMIFLPYHHTHPFHLWQSYLFYMSSYIIILPFFDTLILYKKGNKIAWKIVIITLKLRILIKTRVFISLSLCMSNRISILYIVKWQLKSAFSSLSKINSTAKPTTYKIINIFFISQHLFS